MRFRMHYVKCKLHGIELHLHFRRRKNLTARGEGEGAVSHEKFRRSVRREYNKLSSSSHLSFLLPSCRDTEEWIQQQESVYGEQSNKGGAAEQHGQVRVVRAARLPRNIFLLFLSLSRMANCVVREWIESRCEVRAEKTRVSKTSTDGPRRTVAIDFCVLLDPTSFFAPLDRILMNHLFSRHAQWVNVRAWIVIPQGKDVPGPRVTARREKSSVLWVLTMAFATDPRGTLSLRLAKRSLRIYRTRKTNFFRTTELWYPSERIRVSPDFRAMQICQMTLARARKLDELFSRNWMKRYWFNTR